MKLGISIFAISLVSICATGCSWTETRPAAMPPAMPCTPSPIGIDECHAYGNATTEDNTPMVDAQVRTAQEPLAQSYATGSINHSRRRFRSTIE